MIASQLRCKLHQQNKMQINIHLSAEDALPLSSNCHNEYHRSFQRSAILCSQVSTSTSATLPPASAALLSQGHLTRGRYHLLLLLHRNQRKLIAKSTYISTNWERLQFLLSGSPGRGTGEEGGMAHQAALLAGCWAGNWSPGCRLLRPSTAQHFYRAGFHLRCLEVLHKPQPVNNHAPSDQDF